jgi:hypothetical protein
MGIGENVSPQEKLGNVQLTKTLKATNHYVEARGCPTLLQTIK